MLAFAGVRDEDEDSVGLERTLLAYGLFLRPNMIFF